MEINKGSSLELVAISHTTTMKVTDIGHSMIFRMNKSTGVDGIPIRFIKLALDTSANIIGHIINQSLHTLTVPDGWKQSCITPLFKEGDRDSPSNY